MNAPRFLTLTIAASPEPLEHQLAHLRRSFAKLRRTDAWRSHVVGGFYVIEITHNDRTGKWHPHLHAVVDGTYFPQRLLANTWHEITGDSFIVDIRPCHGRRELVRYVSKYVTKPTDTVHWPAEVIVEWALATAGARMLSTFGSLHGTNGDPRDPNTASGYVSRVCSVYELSVALSRNLPDAEAAVRVLHAAYPAVAALLPGLPRDPPFDTPPPTEAERLELPRRLARLATAVWRADQTGAARGATRESLDDPMLDFDADAVPRPHGITRAGGLNAAAPVGCV